MSDRVQLKPAFYRRADVVEISRDLLGKSLCAHIDGELTSAVITETEAYAGIDDRASHAYGNRRTARTEPMYAAGGIAYVYLCYGIHHLFNVVTNVAGTPHAVLIRAGLPLDGIAVIRRRRRRDVPDRQLLQGPGTLSQGLGLHTAMTGVDLAGDSVWIEDRGMKPIRVEAGPRIGVDYAGKDARRPYRFVATM